MSVPLTLLGLLDREPSHGYDLKRDYDSYFGRGKPLPFGQVYATLGRLARDGKVLPGEVEPGSGPERKRYAITEMGRHEVDPATYMQIGVRGLLVQIQSGKREVIWPEEFKTAEPKLPIPAWDKR